METKLLLILTPLRVSSWIEFSSNGEKNNYMFSPTNMAFIDGLSFATH